MGRKHSKRRNTLRKVVKRRNTKRRKYSKRRVIVRRNTKRRNTKRKNNKTLNGYKIIKRLNPHKSSIKYGGVKEDYLYDEEQLLGEGGFGQVFLTTNSKEDNKLYAMKIILFEYVDSESSFLNEIKILKKIESIPNVCHYIEDWKFKSGEYGATMPGGVIIMDYIAGVSFDKLLYNATTPEGLVSSLDLSIYIKQLSETIEKLHALGIYHNDIKQANIMISGKQAYLIDFGCADINKPPPEDGTNPSSRGHVLKSDIGTWYIQPTDTHRIQYDQYDTYSLIIILYDFMNYKGIVNSKTVLRQESKDSDILRLLEFTRKHLKASKINITDNYIDLVIPLIKAWENQEQRNKWSAKMLSKKIMEDIADKLNLIANEYSLSRGKLIDEYKAYFKNYIGDDIMTKYIHAGVTAAKNETVHHTFRDTTRWRIVQGDETRMVQLLNNIYIKLFHKLYIICNELELQLQADSKLYNMQLAHDSFIGDINSIKELEAVAAASASAIKANSLLENNIFYDPTIDPIFIALPACAFKHKTSYIRQPQKFYYGFLLPPRMELGGWHHTNNPFRVIYYNQYYGYQRGPFNTFDTFDVRTMVYYEFDDHGEKLKTLQQTRDPQRLEIIDTESDIPTYPIIIDVDSIPKEHIDIKSEIIEQQKIYAINAKKERIVYKVNRLYRLEKDIEQLGMTATIAHKEALNEEIKTIVSELTYCADKASGDYTNYCEVMINAFIYNELIRDKGYPRDLLEEAITKYKTVHNKDPDIVTVTELVKAVVVHVLISQANAKVKEKLRSLNIPLSA